MHGPAVDVKEGLPFARHLSLDNSADSYLCFLQALLNSLSYFLFLWRSPSSSLCMVFDSISSSYMRFSQLTDLLICFSLETLMSTIFLKNWDSHHARLNSHYEAWSYKKKKHKKIKAYRKSL